MSWSGSVGIAANDFGLGASGAPALKSGLFFFGSVPTQVPFGDGYRCISAPVRRLPIVQTTSSGTAAYALDFTDASLSSSVIAAGQTWKFQFWYRDPTFGTAGVNLTDGLSVTFCD